jgi:phosphinothricin acetyltransferase
LVKIRKAELKDLGEITEIYNYAILKTVATFDTEVKSLDQQKKWFEKHGPKNPIIVAEKDVKVVGWASLSEYSTKCAYSDTAEISLYVKEDYQGMGIGKKLMKEIIDEGKKAGLHAIISRITEGNEVSVKIHKEVGFEHIGIYKEVGFKFGKKLDVYLMQKIYK